jgi:plastocyanin
MYAARQRLVLGTVRFNGSLFLLGMALALPSLASPDSRIDQKPMANTVKVSLSEWKVQLAPARVPPGSVVFKVTNSGTIPHAFEVEGRGLEKRTTRIQPGGSVTLKLDLRAGSYEAYCPMGRGSHQMLGMKNQLMVGGAQSSGSGASW